jgi:hypothetical protein
MAGAAFRTQIGAWSAPLLTVLGYMPKALRRPAWVALLVVSFGIPAFAQTEQFWLLASSSWLLTRTKLRLCLA